MSNKANTAKDSPGLKQTTLGFATGKKREVKAEEKKDKADTAKMCKIH